MRLIPDEGTGAERIVVIDDQPGRWEEVRNRPCAGPAGGRMDEWLEAVRLTRKDVYWMHVVRERYRRVTDDDLGDFYHRLAQLKGPVVLVPTGEWGLQALTGKKGIEKWRGSILSYTSHAGSDPVKVIPTLAPGTTFKFPSLERRSRFDWARISSDSQFSELRLPERFLHIRPGLADIRELLSACQRSPSSILGVDIETPRELTLKDVTSKLGKKRVKKVYGPSRITCVAFALAPGEAISIPTTLEYWGSAADLLEVWRLIRAICACPIAKVLQNGLFDSFYLQGDHQVVLNNFVYDTMDMHHALDSTDEHSLAYIASTWTREPYWKDDGKEDDDFGGNVGDLDQYWTYNCRDAAVTRELAPQLEAALREDGKWQLYLEHYPPLRAPLLSMMLTGIKRDVAATKVLADELKAKNASIRTELDAIVRAKLVEQRLIPDPQAEEQARMVASYYAATTEDGLPPIGIKTKTPKVDASVFGPKSVSPKKLAWYLYDVLRIPKRTKKDKATGDRKVTTDEVALRTIAINYPHKVGAFMGDEHKPGLLAFRRNDKIGSFVKEEVADADGYVRCSYRRATETHRLSSSKNPRRTGQNLQNVDRDVRRVYVPDAGTVFVECDLCVDEETQVLKTDLTWAEARTIKAGDEVIGFDENFACGSVGAGSKYRRAFVTANEPQVRDCLKIVTTKGTVICSKEHLWPARRKSNNRKWRRADTLQIGDKFSWFVGTWDVEQTYDAGWLSGFFDGEGWTSHTTSVSVGQNPGPTLDRVRSLLAQRGFRWVERIQNASGKPTNYGKVSRVVQIRLQGGEDSIRFLGQIRPPRLFAKQATFWEGRRTWGHKHTPAVITAIEEMGMRTVYPVSTTTKTFIANGMLTHNSQAEDRVVKAYTGDAALIAQARTLPHEFDVHTHNAAAIFQISERDVSKEQRYLGKKAVHASNYDMKGKRLSEELLKEGYVRTADECQRMIDRRFEASPGIRDWQQRTRMEVMRTRELYNSWGWAISFKYERLGDDVYRRAYAYRPQSDIGILTNLWGLVPLYNWILEQRQRHRTEVWRRTRLVLQVHDALVACCPPETAWPVASAMRFFLERPHAYGGVELTIPVDVSTGLSWAKSGMTSWKRFPTQAQVEEVAYGLLKG